MKIPMMRGELKKAEKFNTNLTTFDNLVMTLHNPSYLERDNEVSPKKKKKKKNEFIR
jgi:hypothetical protein